jgi:hypothetical protein
VLVNLSAVPWEVALRSGETVWLATAGVVASGGALVIPRDTAVVAGL